MSVLTRFFGWRNFDLVEDMVQATLLDALQAWRRRGLRTTRRRGSTASPRTRSSTPCGGRRSANGRWRSWAVARPPLDGATRRTVSRHGDRGQPAADDVRLLPPALAAGEPARPDAQGPVRLRQLGNRPGPARRRGDGQETAAAGDPRPGRAADHSRPAAGRPSCPAGSTASTRSSTCSSTKATARPTATRPFASTCARRRPGSVTCSARSRGSRTPADARADGPDAVPRRPAGRPARPARVALAAGGSGPRPDGTKG